MAFTSTPPRRYDVFLSFRGKDTREGFTEHLYQKLRWHNLVVFKDDEVPERGMPISEKLLTAIEESKTAIVVLSPNFASSTWCLDELLKILECMEAKKAVFPVFYDVDPYHVRYQLGNFAEAFVKHEHRIKEDLPKVQVQLWRDALTRLANFVGWTSKDYGSEVELIDGIVEQVQSKVNPFFMLSGSTEKLVGMDIHLKEFMQYLEPEAADVRFLGICGIRGVGKTTLSRLVYERFSHNFEVSCFLANVKEVYKKQGVVHLQNQLLSQIFKDNFVQVSDVRSASRMIEKSLQNKRVLLILDDVDDLDQLYTLARKADWFGKRSRIIITTIDRHLDLLAVREVNTIYKLCLQSEEGSYQLFSRKAFHTDTIPTDYMHFFHVFARCCGGHSLALNILGSFLYNKGPDIWEGTLNELYDGRDDLYSVMKLCYYGLNENEKQVFLDIACFFRGEQKEQVIKILGSYFVEAHLTVNALVEKTFLTISSNNSVEMHDLIQNFGWMIVHEKCYREPGLHSRLWRQEDIMHVLVY